MSLSVSKQIVVMPGEACKNCNNYDPQFKCPPMMYSQLCTSFEPVDPGDVETIEEVPYQRESLGSVVGDEPPKERFDVVVEKAEVGEAGGEEEEPVPDA